ncbi:MAG: hypothetical protein QW304_00105 [Thermoproteota archaeon]
MGLDGKCKYTSKCLSYRRDSFTCNNRIDRKYCGIFRDWKCRKGEHD